jgi:hypothetical protein
MATSPDLSLIAGYAGDHKGDLFKKMVLGMEAGQHLTILPNVKDQTPLINLRTTKGLRPYTPTPLYESELQYAKRTLTTGLGKKEFLLDPQAYRNSYLSKYMGASANDNRIPFEQFTNEVIVDEFGDEINTDVIYFGRDKSRFTVLDPAIINAAGALRFVDTNGVRDYYIVITTTTAGDNPTNAAAKFRKINGRAVADGLEVHILEAIAGGKAAVTVGEITNVEDEVFAVPAIQKVYRALDPGYRKVLNYAFMSYDTFDKLNDDLEEKQKYTVTDPSTNQVMEMALYVPGTNRRLIAVACGWMGDSERIIVTQKENVIIGCDLLSDANQINTNENLWTIEMGLLFNVGVNFALMDAVAYNDRA